MLQISVDYSITATKNTTHSSVHTSQGRVKRQSQQLPKDPQAHNTLHRNALVSLAIFNTFATIVQQTKQGSTNVQLIFIKNDSFWSVIISCSGKKRIKKICCQKKLSLLSAEKQ